MQNVGYVLKLILRNKQTEHGYVGVSDIYVCSICPAYGRVLRLKGSETELFG